MFNQIIICVRSFFQFWSILQILRIYLISFVFKQYVLLFYEAKQHRLFQSLKGSYLSLNLHRYVVPAEIKYASLVAKDGDGIFSSSSFKRMHLLAHSYFMCRVRPVFSIARLSTLTGIIVLQCAANGQEQENGEKEREKVADDPRGVFRRLKTHANDFRDGGTSVNQPRA